MEDKTPSGPVLPTREAIEIMNTNAAAAAKRSRYASLVTAQGQASRDALRRDYAPRVPTGPFEGTQAVPADTTPPRSNLPVADLNNLVDQFQGTGGDGRGGNSFGRSGGSSIGMGNSGGNASQGASSGDVIGDVHTVKGEGNQQLAIVQPQGDTGGWVNTGYTRASAPPLVGLYYPAPFYQTKWMDGTLWYKEVKK